MPPPAKSAKAAPISAVEGLGFLFLTLSVMPLIGKEEYLNVSLVCKTFQDAYSAYTQGSKLTRGLTEHSSMNQAIENIDSGFDRTRAVEAACAVGRVDLVERIYAGLPCGVQLSTHLMAIMARNGRLSALKEAADSTTIQQCLTHEVLRAAVDGRHLNVIKYFLDAGVEYGREDIQHAMGIAFDKGEMGYVYWGLGRFPRSWVACGAAFSGVSDALEVYKYLDITPIDDASGHFDNLMHVMKGGSAEVSNYLHDTLYEAVFGGIHVD